MNNISDDGGVAHWVENETGGTFDQVRQPLMAGGQLWWNTPVSGLRAGAMVANMFDLGLSANVQAGPGPYGPMVAHVSVSGDCLFQQYSLEYTWKSWTFQAEYYTFNYRYDEIQNVNSGPVLLPPPYSSVSSRYTQPDAWYVSAAYRFNKWLEVGSYYTERYADVHQRGGSADSSQKDLALSFRFDPKDWWIVKLEGHYINGTALLQDDASNPARNDNGWFMLAVKTTFSF
jgi:hypothetical protein